jgi:hypothetical protein
LYSEIFQSLQFSSLDIDIPLPDKAVTRSSNVNIADSGDKHKQSNGSPIKNSPHCPWMGMKKTGGGFGFPGLLDKNHVPCLKVL